MKLALQLNHCLLRHDQVVVPQNVKHARIFRLHDCHSTLWRLCKLGTQMLFMTAHQHQILDTVRGALLRNIARTVSGKLRQHALEHFSLLFCTRVI